MKVKNHSEKVTSPAMVIANRLRENKNSLYISRVPIGTKDTFIKIADEEFCSDYGMLLKFLIDKVTDYDLRLLFDKITEQEERINILEDIKHKGNNTPTIKTLGGKIIRKEETQ